LATGFTNQPTAVKHGRIPVWKNPSALRRSRRAQRTATRSLPRCLARSGAIRPIAASTKRRRRQNWNQVLKGPNLSTGCTDVAIDPANPDTMFAAMWDFRRKGWEYRSGGESPTAPSASGLFRSTDGGNTWTEITAEANMGFPKKPYGRLAVAIAPSNAKRVYAFVESPDSALFVSDDGGAPGTSEIRANGWCGGRFTSPT
jgi:hypothetical protein